MEKENRNQDGSGGALAEPAALKIFCSKDEYCKILMAPYSLDGFTYATDGKIVIRVPGELVPPSADVEARETFAKIPGILEAAKASAISWICLTSVPEFDLCETCKGIPPASKDVDCPECDGGGEVSFSNDFNDYVCDCLTCDGDGEVTQEGCEDCNGTGHENGNKAVYCGIQGSWFDLALLARVSQLSGLRIGLHESASLNAHYFTWDDGDGVLMPLRALRDDEDRYTQKSVGYEIQGPLFGAEARKAGG